MMSHDGILPSITIVPAKSASSDSHDPNTRTPASTQPDIFNYLSAAIPSLRHLDEGARTATCAERKVTFLGGCRLYPKAMAWSIFISSTLIMEGYDTLLITSFFGFPAFRRAYGVSTTDSGYDIPPHWKFALPAAANAGEVLGLLLNGWLAERMGYRKTIAISLVFLFLCVFLLFFGFNLQMLLAGEILCGLPWGVFQTLSTTYAAELLPVMLRGYLLSSINACWEVGSILAAGVIRAQANNTSQWSYRIPFAIQWAIGIPILVGVLFAPESPWWLIRHNRPADSRASLLRLTTDGTVNVDHTIAMMTHTNEAEQYLRDKSSMSYWACFKGTDLRRTEITCLVWVAQQICGMSLAAWPPYFYEQASLSVRNAFDLTVISFGVAIAGNLVAWLLLSRVGRRRLYLSGLLALMIVLLATGSVGIASPSRGQSWAIGSLLILLIFIYNITVGPVCYVLVAEIPSTRLRMKTVVLARVAYNLAGIFVNWMTSQMLSPTAWNWKGKSAFFFAGMTFLILMWCYWRLPETFGLSYLEIDVLFARKAKASKFRELQKTLKRQGYFSVDRDELLQSHWRGY